VRSMDDAALVEAARSGDGTAWARIYDRYADRLHDHCHRLLRDRDEAADALHDAFIAAARNLHQLRDPSRLRPWLYSICRHEALRRVRRRQRVELTDEVDDMRAVEVDLDRGASAEELQELVWSAAAGLSERDQALLDLSVRQGLEGQDLADAMGVSLSASYVLMSRLRDQVERSLGALLIARLGRDDCDELATILQGWDGRFTPLLRKRVARHVDRCDTCSARRAAVLSPAALLAAAPLVPAPADLRERVLAAVTGGEPGPDVPFTREGFAAPLRPARPRRWARWAAAAAVLVGAGAAVAVLADDDGTLVVAEGTSTTVPPPTSSTTTPSTTATTEPVPDLSTTAPEVAAPTAPPEAPPATTAPPVVVPPSSAPPDTTSPTIASVTATPNEINLTCQSVGPYTTTVLASVADADAVTLSWEVGPHRGSTPMARSGSGWTASFGPFDGSVGGQATYTVTARDAAGNSSSRSGTVDVIPCPG